VSAWRSTGLWIAVAAVVATSGAARLPATRGTHAATAPAIRTADGTEPPPSQPSGNVDVTIPVAAFGPSDGAPQALLAGRAYPVDITVWVAATSGPAAIEVRTSSGRLSDCAQRTVPTGVARLHCSLVVPHGAARYVSIAITARTHDEGIVVRAYSHTLAQP
jgi:hypothetical protein